MEFYYFHLLNFLICLFFKTNANCDFVIPFSPICLITVNDFNQGKLHKNDILFINWQKLVSKKAEDRVLRRPDEEELRKEQDVTIGATEWMRLEEEIQELLEEE